MVYVKLVRDGFHVVAYYITDEGNVHMSVAFTKRKARKKLLEGGVAHRSEN